MLSSSCSLVTGSTSLKRLGVSSTPKIAQVPSRTLIMAGTGMLRSRFAVGFWIIRALRPIALAAWARSSAVGTARPSAKRCASCAGVVCTP